jgi:hypothetical protein
MSYGSGATGAFSDYLDRVRNGEVAGARLVQKFGSALDVGTAWVPVTESKTYQTPAALTSLEMLSSDDTNDKAGQGGALTVTVYGIGTGWALQEETVVLNGTTPVALTNQFFRVYRMRVATSGTYGTAAAPSHNSTITLRTASAGATWAVIVPELSFGFGQSEIGVFSCEIGKKVTLVNYALDSEGNKPAHMVLYVREGADDVSAPFTPMQIKINHEHVDGHLSDRPDGGLGPFVGPCDIGWMVAAAASTPDVEARMTLLVEDA